MKLFLLFLLAALTALTAKAEKRDENKKTFRAAKPTSITTIDHIVAFDANRIYNYVVNNGDLVTDNVGGGSGFHWPSVPRTSREQQEKDLRGENTADYSSGLWVAGIVNGQIRTAIVEYTSEYIAGKILPNGQRDDTTLPQYRIYKIIRGDGPGVKDWDEWPVSDGAPFNPDGTPQLIGDQTLWFVMNDLDPTRHQGPITGSPPIGLEVQTTVFGFNRADPLGDAMFVKWAIINKGAADLDSAFVGLWDDPDLGDASDDLVGCDTMLGLGFVYNGDSDDGQYRRNTPALGFDFFQGPEVPKESGHFLKMTAFAKYTGGAPAGFGDPQNPIEIYNYMNGHWANGDPFFDPTTGQVTKFIHAGDPVIRQGWLDSPPSDRRFLMSSGPFKLAVGDTQKVVGAKIIAPGTSPVSSIRALRFYDTFAQSAYDNDFFIFDAPSPKVEVRRLEQEIILTWLEGHETLESFNRRGYRFQGYRVYQGASKSGPFIPIATFDLVDGIQDIIEPRLDATNGRILEELIIAANDAGVQRYISIKTDTIFNVGQPLSNYRDYYFAVTSYCVDLDALPKVVESPLVPIRVAPSAPDYGVSIETKTGAKLELTPDKGKGDGEFFYQIVDPAAMQTATYRLTWNDDSMPELGAYTWNLDRDGVRLLSQQPQGELDVESHPRKDAPIADGLQIQIFPFTFETPVRILNHRQSVDASVNDNGLRLWSVFSFGITDDRSSTFWGGGSYDAEQLQADLEFRFTGVRLSERANDTTIVSRGQFGIIRSRSNADARAVVRLPFELWDIENNIQINVFVTSRNADRRSPWGDNGVPQYYRIAGRDYITPVHTPYSAAAVTAAAFDRTDSNATWILFFHSGEQQPVSQWSTGDRYLVRFANPTIPGVDEYTFTTTAAVVSGQTALAKSQLQRINIVPNPYWAHNPMERDSHNRLVRITNLPSQGAKIRIFNLAGDLVRVIDDSDRRAEGTAGLQYVNWDLRNDAGIPVGSGVYLIHVEVPGVGVIVKKAAIIMGQELLEIF